MCTKYNFSNIALSWQQMTSLYISHKNNTYGRKKEFSNSNRGYLIQRRQIKKRRQKMKFGAGGELHPKLNAEQKGRELCSALPPGATQEDESELLVERVGGDERGDHEHVGDAAVDSLPVDPPPPSRGRRRRRRLRRRLLHSRRR